MELKDYLHLYLGCPIRYRLLVQGTDFEWHDDTLDIRALYSHLSCLWQVKPILRPLSDITKIESEFTSDAALKGKPTIYMNAEITAFLLSRHFDLFGLIEAGLAIDSTKNLKPTL